PRPPNSELGTRNSELGVPNSELGTRNSEPRIGYVPQNLEFDRGAPLSVMDFLAMGWQRSPLWLGVNRRTRARARELLSQVKAERLETRMLGALSGGELRRVMLALALECDPEMLILDEPSAGVDVQGGIVICELLDELRARRGFTQLMVTHDLSMVKAHATHVICLNRRVTAEGKASDILRPEILAETFGIHAGVFIAPHNPNTCPQCAEEKRG
ncbi:MAG: ATP-binding cassette domain-containing protein, partial [Candidatus Sumerlaeota bacterium]|nr:ATP-binding cassette domain-containing protein [Candidatus Sumerlaeota bacterium]